LRRAACPAMAGLPEQSGAYHLGRSGAWRNPRLAAAHLAPPYARQAAPACGHRRVSRPVTNDPNLTYEIRLICMASEAWRHNPCLAQIWIAGAAADAR